MIDKWERGKDQRHCESVRADSNLEQSVESEWTREGFRAPPEVITAKRKAAHESGEHRADCKCRCTEHEHQLAHPDNLVDQAAHSGSEEAKQNHPQPIWRAINPCCVRCCHSV